MDIDDVTMHPSLTLPDPMDIVIPSSHSHEPPLHDLAHGEADESLDLFAALAMLSGGPGQGGSTPKEEDPLVGSESGSVWRLYLVLDTNVLLFRSTLRVLEQISRRYGPGCGRPIEVVAIIPWTVLLELDGLKSRSESKGESMMR